MASRFIVRENTCLSFVKKRFNRALIHMLLQEANVERDKEKVSYNKMNKYRLTF